MTITPPVAAHIRPHEPALSADERRSLRGQAGASVWFTGLSGAGKSTIAASLEARLVRRGLHAFWLDGDNLRHGLNGDLGFSDADRAENVRRVAEVARLFAQSGAITLVSVISPFRTGRQHARIIHQNSDLKFLEVFVRAELSTLESRDPKGLYRRARAGELRGLTGVDAPYEPPTDPDLVIETDRLSIETAVNNVEDLLIRAKVIAGLQRTAP